MRSTGRRPGRRRGRSTGAQRRLGRPARPRIDHVAVPGRRRRRRTARPARSCPGRRRAAEAGEALPHLARPQVDRPAAVAAPDREHAAAAGGEQGVPHAAAPQDARPCDRGRSPCRRCRGSAPSPAAGTGPRAGVVVQSHAVHAHQARAGSISAGDGSRPSRRRNPQQRLSGVAGDVERPSGLRVKVRRTPQQRRTAPDPRATAGARGAVDADISLVWRNTVSRASMRSASSRAARAASSRRVVLAGQRDLEAAGHRRAMDAQPSVRRPGGVRHVEREQRADG